MLKLKFQYFGHLMWRTDSFEKTLMLGKIEGRRRRGWQRMRWLGDISIMMGMSLNKLWELVMDRNPCVLQSILVAKSQTRLSDWTELSWDFLKTTLKFGHIPKAHRVKNLLAMQGSWFGPWVQKISWRKEWLPTQVFLPGKFHGESSLADYSP